MRSSSFILRDGRFFIDGRFEFCSVKVVNLTIREIASSFKSTRNDVVFPLEGAYVVPGLINAHDHLEFDLFERIGNPPYKNYVEWGEDIHRRYKGYIRQVLKVPLKFRLLWGAYKNILSGVTTVVHHNTFYHHFRFGYPIEVFKNYSWIHSLALDKHLQNKIKSKSEKPCIVHLAEGTDDLARSELATLQQMGGLKKNTIIVHGIGLSDADIQAIVNAGAGVIWCPNSNLFLFHSTTPVEKLLEKVPLALGTDSTLTGSPSLYEEIRQGQRLKGIQLKTLLALVTSAPASMFKMKKGKIHEGYSADFLLFDSDHRDGLEGFLNLEASRVKCLIKNGTPLYGDKSMTRMFQASDRKYARIRVSGSEKKVIGDFHKIVSSIRQFLPSFNFNGLAFEYESIR